MRVLLVTDWNRQHGGAEAFIAALRKGLILSGDEVRLLTSSAGSAADGEADDIAFGSENSAVQSVLQIYNPFAAACVTRTLKEFRPDVVVVNMFAHHLSPAALFPLKDVPSVLLVSDYKTVCPIGSKLLPDYSLCTHRQGTVCLRKGCTGLLHWLRDRPRYFGIQRAVKSFSQIVTCSEWVKDVLQANDIASKTLLLPTPWPIDEPVRQATQYPRFLFLGRLEREKGADVLLETVANWTNRPNNLKLCLVGRGSHRNQLEQLTRELNLEQQVEFVDWLDKQSLVSEIMKSWTLVVPSLWAEPLGLVAVEAVVRGVPVIASQDGGLAEIVEQNESGLLFPNGDQDGLRRCLEVIVNREVFPSLTLSPEVVARKREQFALQPYVDRFRELLHEVVMEYTSS